ncbi:hypothetical protein GW933_00250 [Candidatus Falkowbacteria bacterium]|uniref:Uncharacterized protein n=1 Tax=Candidatus Buchananbacteria bacterium CG10_big_fil_rev_8_21_14_0_10_33_19 TaxID=1974525 RepID=A0A2H0W2V0_9BACT|nr:hypothetical protein [Candidatus Falkowbacteria bacterium]PIS05689.1 MAG: hypothetical protein COT80_02875 [Candidatus Buchananbacteria bacterium CG10_big_fil_rev_8_21_14_0_10_33_19]
MKNSENNIIPFPSREVKQETIESGSNLDLNNLTKMLEYLTALINSSGKPSTYSLEFKKEILDNKNDEELIDILNSSSETNWQSHPAYYQALVAVLISRKLIPKL